MTVFCEFEMLRGSCTCKNCGTAAKCDICENCRRKCHSENAGLGDRTEKLLETIGITPELVKAAKKKFGLAPTCNCAGRKQWLNRVSDWFAGEMKKNK